jgi:hypothetical protein
LVKYAETSSPRDAISAISSAVGIVLDVFGTALLFLRSRLPGRDQMVVFAFGVMPDLKDDGTEAAAAPSDCTKLFRIAALLVNHVHLVEDLPRVSEAYAMFLFDVPALLAFEVEAHGLI